MGIESLVTLPSSLLGEPTLAVKAREALARTEQEIRRLLSTPDQTLAVAVQNIITRPGKRLRPLVAILGALAARGECDRTVIRGAAAVELLHLASLLHDDVIDEAALRSGRPTFNAALGNQPAVLLGDFFFARALSGAARISPAHLRRFLAVAGDLVVGEFGQTAATGRLPRVDSYLTWIEAKTASLFALAASFGRMRDLEGYGHAFGLAYQLRDDLLDLTAAETEVGKPTLNDCRRGLFTYPVIVACAREPEALGFLAAMRPVDPAWHRELKMLLHRSGAIDLTWAACRYWAERACARLVDLPPGQAREALAGLARWVGGPRREAGNKEEAGRE